MSPFRRTGSPYWQVWLTVPGYDRVGPWSTGTTDAKRAESMEAMLRELPMRGHGEILRMIGRNGLSLADVYVAHIEGRLAEVRSMMKDPLLATAVQRRRVRTKDERILHGLHDLERLAPQGARVSWLADPKNISEALHTREREGLKRNSVRRSLYRACCEVLQDELGSAEKTRILSEVRFPTAKDERDAKLQPAEIASLLTAAENVDPRFGCMIGLAVTSGVDRAPLLKIRPRDFDEATGELHVRDTKTAARPRTLLLSVPAANYLRRGILLSKPGADGLVFPWTIHQVRNQWDAAREAAGLDWLRFKDLRSVFADAFVRAGGTLKDLQAVLGHSSGKTSMRYTRVQPVEQRKAMEGAAAAMGFSTRPHLKVEEA